MIADIHDKYFSEPISSLDIDSACIEPILKSLDDQKPSATVFDPLHDVVSISWCAFLQYPTGRKFSLIANPLNFYSANLRILKIISMMAYIIKYQKSKFPNI
mgnify:CR=1 FL=1